MANPDTGLEIISISIGNDLNNCMRWNRGQETRIGKGDKSKKVTISDIVFDEEYSIRHNCISYVIYVIELGEGKTQQLLKRYTNLPISVTYDL